MDQFPVETAKLRCRVDGMEAKTDRDGRPVLDRATGQPKYSLYLSVWQDDRPRPGQWTVTVVGEPKITVDQLVTLHGLIAFPWEQGDRHGIALRADSVQPVAAQSAQSARQAS